mgnify:CR=1 FL=1
MRMRSKSRPRNLESLYRVLDDLGLNDCVRISELGSIVKVEVKYDPLERERKTLNLYRVQLKSLNSEDDPTPDQLVQQIDQLLKRIELTRVERVLVAAPSPEGLKLLEDQLISIQKDILYRKSDTDELRRLVRLFISYIREYLRRPVP